MWNESKVSVPDWDGVRVTSGGGAGGSSDDSLTGIDLPAQVLRRELEDGADIGDAIDGSVHN
jgi:hypothetical protein